MNEQMLVESEEERNPFGDSEDSTEEVVPPVKESPERDSQDSGSKKVEIPWDTSPPSQAQLSYVRELLIAIGNADLESQHKGLVSEAISGLNKARNALGVPFREFGI